MNIFKIIFKFDPIPLSGIPSKYKGYILLNSLSDDCFHKIKTNELIDVNYSQLINIAEYRYTLTYGQALRYVNTLMPCFEKQNEFTVNVSENVILDSIFVAPPDSKKTYYSIYVGIDWDLIFKNWIEHYCPKSEMDELILKNIPTGKPSTDITIPQILTAPEFVDETNSGTITKRWKDKFRSIVPKIKGSKK